MSKYLRILVFIMLFLVAFLSFGMEPDTIKIQTSDEQEFEIERRVAQTSIMLKGMIEDIKEEAAIIPATITGQQFDLLLPAMLQLAQLHMAESQEKEEKLAKQLSTVVANLKSNNQPLNNKQLIEFITGTNFLNLPFVEPALEVLAQRILNKDDWLKLESLGEKLKDLWHVHPAIGMFTLQHPWVKGIIESRNGNLISWSSREGTIKVWDKTTFKELITLHHPWVSGVIESRDGNLISWSIVEGTIKIWDINNLQAEPITLQHPYVYGVIESRDGYLISWSENEGTIKIWDKNTFRELITLHHPWVSGVIESRDGNLISWSFSGGTIKIWDKNTFQELITLQHPGVLGVIESVNGKNLISWSREEDTIKIWDTNNLAAKPISLEHSYVNGVIESRDGNLISWSRDKGTIKIWDINNLQAEPITLQHPWVKDVIESRDGYLISWSENEGTIKIRDKALFSPTPEQIYLLLAIYFVSKGQAFELTAQELAAYKATFATLSPVIQRMLEKQAPDFIATIQPELDTQSSKRIKIQTSNAQEFDVPLDVARVSETLKNMIEDIGEKVEQSIPLANISGQQFDLLLPAMKNLALLPMAELKDNEAALAQQLQQLVADLKSNNQPLTNQQLIEFIAGANFLNIPLVEPALKALAERTLYKNEIQKLEDLKNKLKDLWDIHPAMRMFLFKHAGVSGVIESRDGNNLISWSFPKHTIKVWDKNDLDAEPITLQHPYVRDVIESMDGKNLISWSEIGGTIKIWDKNTFRELITLEHYKVNSVIESLDGKNLISWSGPFVSREDGTIKIWDINNLAAKPITLQHPWIIGVIESSDGNLISWSCMEGTIKIWDKTNPAQPIATLQHLCVTGVIESKDGNNLISWSWNQRTIKIWDKNDLDAEPITLKHPWVKGVIESKDGSNLISWSWQKGTMKVWDKTNLTAEPITLKHLGIGGAMESLDGKNLISWGKGIIKIWGENNLAEPITLKHPWVNGIIVSMDGNLISRGDGTIKIWDKALFNPTPELIQLLLVVYFVSKGREFKLTAQELAEFKATFTTLSPMIQRMLEKKVPDFIAAIQKA